MRAGAERPHQIELGLRAALRGFVQLAEFGLAVARDLQECFHLFNGVFLGVGLDDRHPGHQFFRLGERSVGHGVLAARLPDARAFRTGQAAFRREQFAGLEAVFHQFPHRGHFLRRRGVASGLLGLYKQRNRISISLFSLNSTAPRADRALTKAGSIWTSNDESQNRHVAPKKG
jgi:hypothetical protein